MPLSTAWDALPHVGAAGRDQPCPLTCADPKVGGTVWGCQPTPRTIGHSSGAQVRWPQLRSLPSASPTTPCSGPSLDLDLGQRSLPSRAPPATFPARVSAGLTLGLSSTVQSGTESHRTCLEAGAATLYPQPVLSQASRSHRCGLASDGGLAKTEFYTVSFMRHYLRRSV
jgi:hypothetical protein